MMISSEQIKFFSKEFGGNEKNTGDSRVQIAILTEEIRKLTIHMIANKKDNISKRGLQTKVSQRKKLLSYLKRKNINDYRMILEKLKIRGN
ncbi:MAG: 30S ribosomal protein S15 [Mycoplasmoidaceae bacterium]